MTTIIQYTGGWLYLEKSGDTMEVWFQRAIVKFIIKPLKELHEVAGINLFIGGGQKYLTFTIQNIFLTSHSDFSTFVDTLKDWAEAGTFSLKIKRDNTNHIEWDGDNTEFTVGLKTGLEGMEKRNPGTTDGTYVIGRLVFVQGA
jgi:hypothetical protein